MIRLHSGRLYDVRLERNGPGPMWHRQHLNADAVRQIVRNSHLATTTGELRNDYLIITDDRGNEQYLYF